MNLIEVVKISKSYYSAKPALQNISFDLTSGDRVGIVGPIGAGKTTLLRILAGILKPTSGQITNILKRPNIGYLPANLGLMEELSVQENLEFWAKTYHCQKESVQIIANRLKIENILNKRVCELSSGLKMKVAFAAAVIGTPEFLILDEPFVNLDIENCLLLCDFLQNYPINACIVISSHNPDYMEKLCNLVLFLKDGKQLLLENKDRMEHAKDSSKITITFSGKLPEQEKAILEKEYSIKVIGQNMILMKQKGASLNDVLIRLAHAGVSIESVNRDSPNLQDLYLRLMEGKHLI